MAKVIFEYDSLTGTITDQNGLTVCLYGMTPFESESTAQEKTDPVGDMIRLRNAGFTADDIIAIKKAELD